MVSKAKEDLPEPDKPVITTSLFLGISKLTFFKLLTRAPRMINFSEGIHFKSNYLLIKQRVGSIGRHNPASLLSKDGNSDLVKLILQLNPSSKFLRLKRFSLGTSTEFLGEEESF